MHDRAYRLKAERRKELHFTGFVLVVDGQPYSLFIGISPLYSMFPVGRYVDIVTRFHNNLFVTAFK